MKYEDPGLPSREKFLKAINSNDISALQSMIVAISLYEDNQKYAEHACLSLSKHKDDVIRGNSILGLGHIGRRFGSLIRGSEIKEKVITALSDKSSYVQGHAESAASDLQFKA